MIRYVSNCLIGAMQPGTLAFALFLFASPVRAQPDITIQPEALSFSGSIDVFAGSQATESNHTLTDNSIRLLSGTIDTSSLDERRNTEFTQDSTLGPGHAIIQFESLPSFDERKELEAMGIRLLDYISNNAYWAAIGNASDAATLQSAGPSIRWAGHADPAHKQSPQLQSGNWPGYLHSDKDSVDLSVLFFKDVNQAEAERALSGIGGVQVLEWATPISVLVRAPVGSIDSLSGLDEVNWVDLRPPPIAPFNVVSASRVGGDVLGAPPYSLDGLGVTVGVWDAGAFTDHPDYVGRLTVMDGAPEHPHAIHVMGTIGGSGAGDPAARGFAPGVELRSWDWNNHISELLGASEIDLSNHSYGIKAGWSDGIYFGDHWFGLYDSTAAAFDSVVFSNGLPMFKAAGNSRADPRNGPYDTIPTFGVSKNILSICATDDTDVMSFFSSWGPADDGRIKPDLCANGVTLYSTGPNSGYYSANGTSMASPSAAGAGALLIEHFRDELGRSPKPHTLKALMIHSADDLGRPGPDYEHGWGLIDAPDSAALIEGQDFVVSTIAGPGEQSDFYATVTSGQPELKVTLVWTDPAGSPSAVQALVNDLDLVLIDPDGVGHFPWTLDPSTPSANATTGVNTVDNVEQVVVANPMAGDWTIEVRGTTVPFGPQEFALVSESLLEAGQFLIRNEGSSSLDVSSITTDTTAPWLQWTPSAPFSVAPGASERVTVSVDFSQAPPGLTNTRLVVASNDPDENPYPSGVDVSVNRQTCYALTLAFSGAGAAPVATPSQSPGCPEGTFFAGEVIQLQASPNPGWKVDSWLGTDDDSSLALTNQLTMPATASTAAVFYSALTYMLDVRSSGASGATITSSTGHQGTTDYQLTLATGTNVVLEAPPVAGTEAFPKAFISWAGCTSTSVYSCTLAMPGADHVVTVSYGDPPPGCHLLEVGHTGSGADPTVEPANSPGCPPGRFTSGYGVSLRKAFPAEGWRVRNWVGTTTAISPYAHNLIMPDEDHEAWVNYDLAEFPLTVTSIGADGVPINAADYSGFTDYEVAVPLGQFVGLSAPQTHPENGPVFQEWYGCDSISQLSCSLTVTEPRQVEVVYAPVDERPLRVVTRGASGIAIDSPTGHGGTSEYVTFVASGETATLIAPEISGGARFLQWENCPLPSGTQCQVEHATVDPITVIAVYMATECAADETPDVLFFDDAEEGTDNWEPGASPNTGESFSPDHSFLLDPATQLQFENELALSPMLNNPVLQFWFWQDMQDLGPSCYTGGLFAEFSTDDGTTWSQFGDVRLITKPYTGEIGPGAPSDHRGRPGWCGPNDWTRAAIDLNGLQGENLKFRLRGTGRIDDVQLYSCPESRADNQLSVMTQGVPAVTITSPTGHGGASDYTLPVASGEQVTLEAPASAGGQGFVTWYGCDSVEPLGVGSICHLTVASDRTVIASYKSSGTQQLLEVASSVVNGVPITSSTGHGGSTYYTLDLAPDTPVNLEAPAESSGAQFRDWAGCDSEVGLTCGVMGQKRVTANYRFTDIHGVFVRSEGVSSVVLESGTGQGGTTPYSTAVSTDEFMELSAPAFAGTQPFVGWTGCTFVSGLECTVAPGADTTVIAHYQAPSFDLDVFSTGANAVPLISPSGHPGTTDYSVTLVADTGVRLVAPEAHDGMYFGSWSGCDSTHEYVCDVSLSSNRAVTVDYIPDGTCGPGDTPNTHFEDDFESGAPGWSHGALIGPDTWALDTSHSSSPPTSWQVEDADQIADQYLVSPAVAIPAGVTRPVLEFQSLKELLTNGSACEDGGVLEYSIDDGASWIRFNNDRLALDKYDSPIQDNFGNPLANNRGWCGFEDWQPVAADLSGLQGQTLRFRFRLGSGNHNNAFGNYWYIDDVAVKSCTPPPGQHELRVRSGDLDGERPGITVSSPTGHGGVTEYVITLEAGTDVTLETPAMDGTTEFIQWIGCPSPTGTTCSFTVDGDLDLWADYEIAGRDVFIDSVGVSGVPITSVSGHPGTTNYQVIVPVWSVIEVEAPPVFGDFVFGGWTGCNPVGGTSCARHVRPSGSNHLAAHYLPGAEVATTSVFSHNGDEGGGDWSHSAPIGPDTWEITPNDFHSAPVSWRATGVDHPSDQRLVSPSIELPLDAELPRLRFWTRRDIERKDETTCYDGGILEYSIDDGSNWLVAGEDRLITDPYTAEVATDTENPLAGMFAWCGQQDWTSSEVDLSGLQGESLRFRFRLGTDNLTAAEGWYIDDIEVYMLDPEPEPDMIHVDSFEALQ